MLSFKLSLVAAAAVFLSVVLSPLAHAVQAIQSAGGAL